MLKERGLCSKEDIQKKKEKERVPFSRQALES
jgi:hypothetical protein